MLRDTLTPALSQGERESPERTCVMFQKILIANRGESDREASASAKPNRTVRAAHAGEFDPMERNHV